MGIENGSNKRTENTVRTRFPQNKKVPGRRLRKAAVKNQEKKDGFLAQYPGLKKTRGRNLDGLKASLGKLSREDRNQWMTLHDKTIPTRNNYQNVVAQNQQGRRLFNKERATRHVFEQGKQRLQRRTRTLSAQERRERFLAKQQDGNRQQIPHGKRYRHLFTPANRRQQE